MSLAGGPEAFGPIIERYQDAVFGVALARLGRFQDAEDVAQTVFVQAFERLNSLRDPARLGAWLRTMAIRRTVDHLRKKRPSANLEQIADDMTEHKTCLEPERNELRQRVLAAIGRLSKPQRETVTLFYINGYSQADVAAMQEVPVGTVKGRLHDAREKLKKDMIHMVADVLKSEAPKDDFGKRVFDLLSLYPNHRVPDRWTGMDKTITELREIAHKGFDGFVQALASPHSPTRRFALDMLEDTHEPLTGENIVTLLKQALQDTNKNVRRYAAGALLEVNVDEERIRCEFIPLIVPLLSDPSKRVRRNVVWLLHDWAANVPLAAATRACLAETDPLARWYMEILVNKIIASQDKHKVE